MPPYEGDIDNEEPDLETLITQGKRDLHCRDYQSAVDNFALACEIISVHKGDLHEDLAEPNLLYGTALLGLARSENQVLGEGVKAKETLDDGDEENNETNAKDEVNGNESEEKSGETEENKLTNGNADITAANSSKPSEEKSEPEQPGTSNGAASEAEDSIEDDEDGGEVPNLQLAWEVLEVARAIFARHDDAEHKLKCAECLELLGEVCEESGDIAGAVCNLKSCLEIRLKDAPNDFRLLAGTHFNLALAYSYNGDFKSSEEAFERAKEALGKCKEEHESELSSLSKEDESNRERIEVLEVQIADVDELIKNIQDRQIEVRESESANVEVVEPPQKTLDKDTPIDDVSHLIKKKKRPVEQEDVEDHPAKKSKSDAVDVKEVADQVVENGK